MKKTKAAGIRERRILVPASACQLFATHAESPKLQQVRYQPATSHSNKSNARCVRKPCSGLVDKINDSNF